jgi:uncharacterized repeat protein (TIGR01451 family)
MTARRISAIALAALVGSTARVEPGPVRTLPGAGATLSFEATGAAGPTETVILSRALADGLRDTAVEETVRVADWPVSPGARRLVELVRRDVYSADARVVAIGRDGEVEVPRSRLVFLWGHAPDDAAQRVLVWVDPDTGLLGGMEMTPEGFFEITPADGASAYRIAPTRVPPDAATNAADAGGFSCGGGLVPPGEELPPSVAGGAQPAVLGALHTATVAVDTDNELLGLKFADNTTNATNYVAQLVAGMTLMYERDLFVRLLQGHTILRLTSAADPWSVPSCPAWPATCLNPGNSSGAQLNEVSSYWSAHYGAVPRALTMMLSGKQTNSSFFSGIAWINGLCSGAVGYSFSQVIKVAAVATDVKFVGHELGHNFGSRHTHCYPTATTPIDTCYNQEAGCYAGPVVCPTAFTITPLNGAPVANVTGTVMSYCHLSPCSSSSAIFHPQTVAVLAPIVDSKVGVCVFPDSGALTPTLTSVSPASGPTSGGSVLTLTGTNFLNGATVSFVDGTGAVAAASVTFLSATQLQATTPAHAGGVVDVIVGNPTKRTATKLAGFAFVGGSKTVAGTFTPGGAVTYTIVLPNPSGVGRLDVAGSDELTDVLPSSLTLVSASASAGTALAIPATGTVTWNGAIAAGSSVTVTIQATVKPGTAPYTIVSNQGTIRFDADGNGTNESTVLTDDPSLPGVSDPTNFVVPVSVDFYTLTPCRIIDTRDSSAIAAGATLTVTATGRCGLPVGAKVLALNVTAVAGTTLGNVVVYPGNLSAPATSTINFSARQIRANSAITGLATNGAGTIAVTNRAADPVHVILDVTGYFQ